MLLILAISQLKVIQKCCLCWYGGGMRPEEIKNCSLTCAKNNQKGERENEYKKILNTGCNSIKH